MPTVETSALFSSSESISINTSALFSSVQRVGVDTSALYSSRATFNHQSGGITKVFNETKRVIYATDSAGVVTELGELFPGQTTLTDVTLADGAYEIEVRSSESFYEEARSRIRFGVVITSGIIESQGLPLISGLIASITRAFSRRLTWNISDVAFTTGLSFGVWRSATSPVVVTGPPDFTVLAYDGSGEYSINLTQTADEFFAVAAIRGSDQGAEREIATTWDLTAPNSPANQFAYKDGS